MGGLGQTSELAWAELNQDRQRHLEVRGANRLVEQLVDRGLPFQLAGLFSIHESTICGLHA